MTSTNTGTNKHYFQCVGGVSNLRDLNTTKTLFIGNQGKRTQWCFVPLMDVQATEVFLKDIDLIQDEWNQKYNLLHTGGISLLDWYDHLLNHWYFTTVKEIIEEWGADMMPPIIREIMYVFETMCINSGFEQVKRTEFKPLIWVFVTGDGFSPGKEVPFRTEMEVVEHIEFENIFANEIVGWPDEKIKLEKTSFAYPCP